MSRRDVLGVLTAAVVGPAHGPCLGIASGAGASAGTMGRYSGGLFCRSIWRHPSLISEPTGPMTVIVTAVTRRTPPPAIRKMGWSMAFTVVHAGGCLFQIGFWPT